MLKTYQDFKNWLNTFWPEKIPKDKKEWKISWVKKLLALIDNPELKAKYRIIVWGTAWKWTTVQTIHEVFYNEWIRVASFMSPHISYFWERIRIWDSFISEKDLIDTANELINLLKWLKEQVSYFVLCFLLFLIASKKYKAEILVMEIWLWGEADAVNQILWSRISVLTFIWEDHLEILWPTLLDVAKTKSKIFNKNTIAWFSYEKKFRDIIQNESPVKIEFIDKSWEWANKILAKRVCEFILNKKLSKLPEVKMPARWESFEIEWKKIILDWAHSKPRIKEIIKKIKKDLSIKYFLLASKNSRSWEYLLPLKDYVPKNNIYFTEYEKDWIVSIDAENLKNIFKCWTVIKDCNKAFYTIFHLMKKNNTLLLTWSFYLCSKIKNDLQLLKKYDIIYWLTKFYDK